MRRTCANREMAGQEKPLSLGKSQDTKENVYYRVGGGADRNVVHFQGILGADGRDP